MGYNIQTPKSVDSRKKLIQDYLETFLGSDSEHSSIHLTSAEAAWIQEHYPQIKLSIRKDIQKVHNRSCYAVTKNVTSE